MKMGRRRSSPLKRLFILIIITAVVFIAIDGCMWPSIANISGVYAQNIAEKAFNDAVSAVLAEDQVSYSSLVTLQKDDSSQISAIQTDTVAMNQLKTQISDKIMENLSNSEYSEFKVPVGTFTGSDLLMGRGPKLSFRLQFAEGVITSYENVFESAGINQTLHRIMLKVKTTVCLVSSWHSTSVEIESSYLIAETILVGSVPSVYADIGQSGIFGTSSAADAASGG